MAEAQQVPASPRTLTAENVRHEQLEYLMCRFGDNVLHLAYSYLRDRYWAEDVAQEVFVRVFLALDRFRGDSSYRTWIYRITVNLCRDQLKSRLRWLPMAPTNLWAGTSEITPGPEEAVLQSAEREELWQNILRLPLNYREVLLLRYYHDLPLKEVARVLGVTVPVVKVRLHRARHKLSLLLERKEEHSCLIKKRT